MALTFAAWSLSVAALEQPTIADPEIRIAKQNNPSFFIDY
jgi:hypothetical protein